MYGVLLLIILAVMGGFIAWLGDKMGMKIGRKKLTIFGLRPKHTSILVTIVTGILISACTLGIMTMVSQDVRTALFGMEALKQELTALSGEVTQKNRELGSAREELQQQERQYQGVLADIEEKSRRLTEVGAELAMAIAQRDTTLAALEDTRQKYGQAQLELQVANQDLLTVNTKLTAANAEIEQLQQIKAQLDGKIDGLTAAKNQLDGEVKELTDMTAKLRDGINMFRNGVMVYRANEVLGQTVIQGGRSREDLEKDVRELVVNTNLNMLRQLNKTDNNHFFQILWVTQDDYQAVVKALLDADGLVLVRVSSEGNVVYGQAVTGHFDLFSNKLVFPRGATVDDITLDIDVSNGSSDVEQKLISFLHDVNRVAIQKGLLPDPLQGTVGTISGADLFNAVNECKKIGGKVAVSAVARDDTYTAGPLKIKLVVQVVQSTTM